MPHKNEVFKRKNSQGAAGNHGIIGGGRDWDTDRTEPATAAFLPPPTDRFWQGVLQENYSVIGRQRLLWADSGGIDSFVTLLLKEEDKHRSIVNPEMHTCFSASDALVICGIKRAQCSARNHPLATAFSFCGLSLAFGRVHPIAGLGTPFPAPFLIHQWVAVEAERLFVQGQTEITPSNTAHLPALRKSGRSYKISGHNVFHVDGMLIDWPRMPNLQPSSSVDEVHFIKQPLSHSAGSSSSLILLFPSGDECHIAGRSRMSASHAVSPYSAQAFTVCLKAAGSYPQCKSVFRKKAGRSGEQCDLNGLSSVQGSSLQTLWVTWHFFASRDTRSTTTITQSMDFGMIAGGLLNGLHGYDPRENDARVTDNYFETLQNGNRAS
ncbi:hypothetical protein CISG_06456 [Coccidioides immitis RMSCC 3703]|uniref:Uncharacterized protein n=2 Tax=Coccidioides immitis TaxID=5501 RepID=A0A0J8QX25_COCIT|nr:hypothetical protein CIRG_04365 [Coccidioides immitis RMSCC 2394]KMU77454.1 hypothetical protein CISG_06456 [Coccidioides immitis RMSCC 3703]